MAFGNLTVDFRQLARVPVRDRAALARSAQASEIFGNLTPSQIAALFPDYYKKFIPQASGGGGMAAGLTGAGTTTGTGISTATSTGTTAPTRPGFIQDILASVTPSTNVGSGVQYGEGSTNGQVEVLKFARRWGISPQAAAGVLNIESGVKSNIQGGAGGNFYGIFQLQGKQVPDLTEKAGFGRLTPQQYKNLSVGDQLKVMDEYYKQWGVQPGFFTGDPQKDAAKMWALQLAPGAAKKINYDDPNAVISNTDQAGIIEAQNKLVTVGSAGSGSVPGGAEFLKGAELSTALPGTEPMDTAAPASDTGIIPLQQGEGATVLPQVQSFDTIITQYPQLNEWYKTATEEEKNMFKDAVVKLPPDKLKSIMDKHPQKTADLAVTQIGQTVTEKEQSLQVALENKEIVPISHGQTDTFISRSSKGVIDAGIENIDSRLVTLGDAGIRAFEKMNPGYTVRVISGKRTPETNSGSATSRHLRGGAVDYEIIDPNGNALSNLGGGKSGARAKAGFDAPKYEELGRYMEAARRKLAKDDDRYADTKVAAGLYFGGDFWMDSMHMQMGGNTALGDLYTGFKSPEQLAAEGQPRVVVEAVRNAIASGSGNSFNETEMEQLSQFLYETGTAPVDVVTKVNPEVARKLEEIQVKKNTAQPLPGTQAITQEPRPDDTAAIPLQQSTANTAPAMKLGGEMNFKEPNTVKESMSLVANGKEVAQFNKNEQVNVEDGKIKVQNEYDKRTKEAQQRNDKGTPTNQYSMRQTTTPETPRTFPDQVKYGIVPQSPSAKRQFETAQFGGYDHFSRRSHSS